MVRGARGKEKQRTLSTRVTLSIGRRWVKLHHQLSLLLFIGPQGNDGVWHGETYVLSKILRRS